MINFDTKPSFEDFDSTASKFQDGQSNEVRISTNLPAHSLGIQAGLIQLLVSWSRRTDHPTLVTHIQSGEDTSNQLSKLAGTPHGLAALLVAKRVVRANGEDISDQARRITARRYAELNRIELKPEKLLLFVADSHPCAPRAAAFTGLAPKDPEDRAKRKDTFTFDFRFNLTRCLKSSSALPLQEEDTTRILEVVYELFANTEEWGTSDISFTPLKNSLRGILAEVVPIRQVLNRFLSEGAQGKALQNYLKVVLGDSTISATHALEISVFDSGVGLAQRNLGKLFDSAVSPSDEYSAVLNCLRKRSTSSADATRGMGLFEVMRLLTRLKGFLRLRSGRLALFRDFISDRFLLDETWEEEFKNRSFYRGFEYLWDWDVDPEKGVLSSKSTLDFNPRPHLDGTLLTVWIPLRIPHTQLPLFRS